MPVMGFSDSELYSTTTLRFAVVVTITRKPFTGTPVVGMLSALRISWQFMKKAPSGPSTVDRNATLVALTMGLSGTETTSFFVKLKVWLAKLGLCTLMSVLYSPGTRPIVSAADACFGEEGAKQIHFTVYVNFCGGAQPPAIESCSMTECDSVPLIPVMVSI